MFSQIGSTTHHSYFPKFHANQFVLSFSEVPKYGQLVCLHPVNDGQIGQGKPLPREGVMNILRHIDAPEKAEPSMNNHWLGRVIYRSASLLVWTRRADSKPRPMWFRTESSQRRLDVRLPTLVFFWDTSRMKLRVMAACQTHVHEKTPLYHAPLCNIYDNGTLCVGNATLPNENDDLSVVMATLEAAVLDTNFTHTSHKNTFAHLNQNDEREISRHIRTWSAIAAENRRPQRRDLVRHPFYKTLEDMIRKLELKA